MAGLIDAVLLDVGGILLLPHPDIVLAALAGHGADGGAAEVRRGHYAGIAAMDRLGRPSWSSYYMAMARTVGVGDGQMEGAIAALRSIYDSTDTWTLVTDGAVETLAALRAAGLKIAIVSNSDGTIADRLRASAVCQLGQGPGVSVDVVLDSPGMRTLWEHSAPASARCILIRTVTALSRMGTITSRTSLRCSGRSSDERAQWCGPPVAAR